MIIMIQYYYCYHYYYNSHGPGPEYYSSPSIEAMSKMSEVPPVANDTASAGRSRFGSIRFGSEVFKQ